MDRPAPGQGMYSNRQSGEWSRYNQQEQQMQQRPMSAVRNTVNPGSTQMARPPPQQFNSGSAPSSGNSRASSFFSSFRKNSKPDPVEPGSISPSTMSSGYSGQPNQTQQAPYAVGAAGQGRPEAGDWNEQGRPNSMMLANNRTQALTQGKSGSGGPSKLISPRVQAVQAQSASHSSSNSMSSSASSIGRRGSSYMKTIATRDAKGEMHPEIQQVVGLTLAHSGKIYCSGPLVRRLERNADGTIVKDAKWADVWAQLGGTTLSVWDMEAIKKASEEGREEPPTYINVTDSQVQVLGSIMTAATTSSPEQKRTNIVTINTAGSNLILFACPSPQTLLSWATALRLASWEKSRIEEIYTGHLFRLSMMEGNQFREPESTLQKGKLEGWAKVRIGGGTEWQRLWIVISLYAVSGSIDAGRPGSPDGSVKKNRLSSFLSGSKSTPSLSGHGSSAPMGGPTIAMYPSNKTKDKKRLLYTATRVTQAFAVYPERPEVINQSTLFKIESTIKDEQLYSMTQSRDRAVEAREGYALIMPEVEMGKPGSGEMVKWLIAVHDAFKLYGRPEGYSWDPRNPRSMFFTYPYGPYRDHLFLDRELAEVLDVRVHETSLVRGALMNILIQRMHAPPPNQSQAQVDQRQGPDGRPQLPPLDFNGEEQGAVDHIGRSALTTIREQSTMSADSHPGIMQNQPATMHQPGSFNDDQRQNGAPPIRNDPRADPSMAPNSFPPGTSNVYTPLTSANFATPPSDGTRSSSATPAQAPSPAPSNSFNPPISQVGGPGYRSWSPQAGNENLAKRANGSTASFGTQPAQKLSLDTNSRTGSPLPMRNGTPARDPAIVNHQQMPSIPSIRTPSTDPAKYHQADTSMANPSHLHPSQQSTSYHTAQPGSNLVASSSRNPASSERPDSHLYDEAGAMYLLSQMEDEPPEVSPLRDLPPQPLPPRLAALERQRANSAGGIDDTEPSPFANNSGGASPFTSSGSVVPQQNPQPSPFNSAFASGSGSSGAAKLSHASGGLAPVASEYESRSQTQPKIAQTQPSSSALPQTGLAANMHPNHSGNYNASGVMTSSPTAMTSRSVEQQEEDHANADALAALTFVDTPDSPEAPKANTSAPPRHSPPTPVSASTSGSGNARQQYQPRSSFAPTAKSVERKTNSDAHQAAIQENRSKPGRGKGKTASKGHRAWGSSDEEEEEDEQEEDSGDERTASKAPNQQAGSPSILSPLPQPHPTHPTHMSELSHAAHPSNDSRTASSRRLPAIPGPSGQSGRSPAPRSPDSNRGQEQYRQPQEYSRPSSSDPYAQQRRPMDYTDEFGRRGPVESGSRGTLDRHAQTLPNRPMWSTMLDPQGETQGKSTGRDTFVRIEPNETMTMAFQPQGLLQAGMQDKQNRSAKQQEANARETGASLINVPNPPPPPQMGLVGAITAHQRDREREGGVGAALTEKERERRLAEERQRKYDELQRAQLDKAMTMSGNNMEMQQGYNPMMLNPMMGWGMPMMYGMNGMGMGGVGGMGGMGGGWGGISPQQQQQQQQQQYQMWAAQQAAAQAYQQAMVSFSQAGSDAGGAQDTPTGRPGTTSPMPGWGPSPMASPIMAPMMPGMMPGMMPSMMPGMGMMPGMMPGYGMGNGSGFLQPGISPSAPRSPINDDSRFSFAHTPQESPRHQPSDTRSRDNHAS